MTVTCYWVRHAPLSKNAPQGCYIGQTDIDAELPKLIDTSLLPEDAVWFASPLKRAMDTARRLKAAGSIQPKDVLKEQDFGTWEGQWYDAVWQEQQDKHDWSRPEGIRPDGGESFTDVCARVDQWLEEVLGHYEGRSLVLVGHAGSIRAGLRHALGVTPAKALLLRIDCLSVSKSVYARDAATGRIEFVNQALPCG